MIQRYGTRGPATSLTRLMNSLMADPFLATMATDSGPVGGSPLNVYEQDDSLIVEAEMPGFDPEDINISIERGMVTIRGEMVDEDEQQDRNYLVREYRRGTFVRSVRLPDTVDTENVQAEFDNGVLRLMFPKAEQAKARKISVAGTSESSRSSRRRRRSSNGHASNGNGNAQATGQTKGEGMTATEAQHADARAGKQSREEAGPGTGSQSSQPATAGSSKSS